MSLRKPICEICLGEEGNVIWDPIINPFVFLPGKKKKYKRHQVIIGGKCRREIMLMVQEDRGLFDGCVTMQEVQKVVRKEIGL